jgi:NAD(P)-dependent dehydrogenase (short-subunit alcohol dehydrogenase family)
MVVEVNIGSMWAKQAVKATPSSAYSMQKQAYTFTQHLAMELADYNIRVNFSPAVVNTIVSRRFLWKRSSRKGT